MGSSSYINNTFSLYPHSKFHNPKIKNSITLHTLKPPSILTTHIHKFISFHPTSIFQTPQIPLTSKPQKEISKFLSEKIVFFLVGSFLFLGCLNNKPVLALPVPECIFNLYTEEKKETQNGKVEDEEMFMNMKLLETNPRNVEALKVVLSGKMKKGKTSEAVEYLEYVERLIDVEPNEVEWRLLQALCYEMMGQLSKSKSLFKEILKERPLLLRALHGLAMVMHKNLEGPAVFEMLNEALQTARRKKTITEERNIRILIAQMHVVKGELEEGLKQFQGLANENPRDFRPYLCQGIIYIILDKTKEVEKQFETYLSLVPEEYPRGFIYDILLTYRILVPEEFPEEFPQRGFFDDVVLAAKTESKQELEKNFKPEFSSNK